MKKIFFLTLLFSGLALSSCDNPEIDVELNEAGKLTVTVDPSQFFAGYNFIDTHHNVNVAELYRTFNSRLGYFIEMRSLVYNKETDELVDSVVTNLSNTNSYTKTLDLKVGKYTVVSTLSFSVDSKGALISMWRIVDHKKLSTAKLQARSRNNMWCIMAVSTNEIEVKSRNTTTLLAKPQPIGSLVYTLFENFQYTNQESYGTPNNTSIRQVGFYTQETAISYNLDPRVPNRVNYTNEGTTNQWRSAITIQSSTEGYIKNTVGFCYLLEPQTHFCFGLIPNGESDFNKYGDSNVSVPIESGKTYLAYWDYFKVGSPYFGEADNNHFNTYPKQ